VHPGKLLLLRHQNLHFLSPLPLRQVDLLPTRRFYKGFSHIQGSVIRPGGVVLKNGDAVYLIDLPPRR
jgi:hypothetical protein